MSRKGNNGRNEIVTHTNRNTVSATGSRDSTVNQIKSLGGMEVGRSRQAATVQLSRVSTRILLAVSIIVQAICVLVLGQYDPSHSGVVRHRLPRSICVPSLAHLCSWTMELPSAILDPSAAVFINCLIIYGLSVILLYDAQKDYLYQHYILGLGSFGGIVISGAMAVKECALSPLKDYMPAAITLTLLVSLCTHTLFWRQTHPQDALAS